MRKKCIKYLLRKKPGIQNLSLLTFKEAISQDRFAWKLCGWIGLSKAGFLTLKKLYLNFLRAFAILMQPTANAYRVTFFFFFNYLETGWCYHWPHSYFHPLLSTTQWAIRIWFSQCPMAAGVALGVLERKLVLHCLLAKGNKRNPPVLYDIIAP